MEEKKYLFLVTVGQVGDVSFPVADIFVYAEDEAKARAKINNIINPKIFGVLKIRGGDNDQLPPAIPTVIETVYVGTGNPKTLKEELEASTTVSSRWDIRGPSENHHLKP